MVESQNPSKYELLDQFAQNRDRSRVRRLGTFYGSMAQATPIAVTMLANEHALVRLATDYPEAIYASSFFMVVGTIGGVIESLDVTRVNSRNGRIAQQIATIEGNPPSSHAQRKWELKRVKRTVNIASRIAPSASARVDLEINNAWRRVTRKGPVPLDIYSHNRVGRWAVKSVDSLVESGSPQEQQQARDAMILAERQWTRVIDNPKTSEYRRRHGLLMRAEIRKKLQQALADVKVDPAALSGYERMSTSQLGTELSSIVGSFPRREERPPLETIEDILEDIQLDPIDDMHQKYSDRDDSLEKRETFANLRKLLAHSAGTRGFNQVLENELSHLYNIGLQDNDEILEAIGVQGQDINNSMIFDPNTVQLAERRLYGYIDRRSRYPIWEPPFHEQYGHENPLRTWLSNRGEDLLSVSMIPFNLTRLTPPEVESWKWEYKRKYKEKLKGAPVARQERGN